MDLKNKTTLANAYFPNKASEKRLTNDYYPTPPIGTLTLLKNYPVPKRIWEPAAGRGHISAELIRNKHKIVSTDLYNYENTLAPINFGVDFLTADRQDVNGIITNPPFKDNLPEKLIRRMLETHEYDFLAILCRITFLESAKRYKLFNDHPLTKVLVFSERINCNEDFYNINHGIGGMICYGWFIWDKKSSNKKEIDWVRPSDYINDL